RAYAEDYPGKCYLGMISGAYCRRHVPFLSFKDVQESPEKCAKVVNGKQYFSDLQRGTLPQVSFYIPNNRNNGHDTNVEYASQWLEKTFGKVFSDPAVLGKHLFILTFDEG